MGDRGKLRVGVVGCGQVGLIHARALTANPRVELVGVCDIDPERLGRQVDVLRVPGYGSVTEMVEKANPELASVVVRYDRLVEPVRECLELGVSVFSEKPISFDPGTILDLVRLAERRQLRFGANFNQRFTLPSQWLRQLRASGQLGSILYAACQYNQGTGDDFYSLREHMIHTLDFWRYHIGEVVAVTGQARWDDDGRRTGRPGGLAATAQFANGALGVFTNSFRHVGDLWNHCELVGEGGRWSCENFVGRAVFRPNDAPAQVKEAPWLERGANYWDSFAVHLDLVVEAMLAGASLPVPAEAAFEVQCLCSAFIQAIETGQRVLVQDVRRSVIDSASDAARKE